MGKYRIFFFKKEALLYFNKYYKTDLEMGIVKKLANKKVDGL